MSSRKFRLVEGVYAYVGELPLGCKLCIRGVKMVIFITGVCHDYCFYCPVSDKKFGKHVTYVDEEPAENVEDLIDEAYRIGASGASITGGDPLLSIEKTIAAIRLLKDVFGSDFHIHLYTSGRYATADVLRGLDEAGLDEIRFHPTAPWLINRIERALRVMKHSDVGVEIPVLPDRVEEIKMLIRKLDEMGVKFINLNEAEVSPSNIAKLMERGYKISESKPVLEGSEEAAIEIVRWALENTRQITVHYCPARYKDGVQMRLRLFRKALRIARPYEEVMPQGLIRVLKVSKIDSRVVELVKNGYGEIIDGVAYLDPRLADLVDGEIITHYPVGNYKRMPFESFKIIRNWN
jgi:pyruvate formate-lyase activating enzyme-like uncharacterized protein